MSDAGTQIDNLLLRNSMHNLEPNFISTSIVDVLMKFNSCIALVSHTHYVTDKNY